MASTDLVILVKLGGVRLVHGRGLGALPELVVGHHFEHASHPILTLTAVFTTICFCFDPCLVTNSILFC